MKTKGIKISNGTQSNKMRHPLFLFVLAMFIVFPLVSANYGSFPANKQLELVQSCDNGTAICSWCNITSVKYPDSSNIVSNVQMTKRTLDFNYTLTSAQTHINGKYLVNGVCSDGGSQVKVWSYDFDITPSGESRGILGFFVLIFIISYGILFFGVGVKNIPMAIFGGLLLISLGLFTLLNGIDIYRNTITEAISLITLGIGAYWAIYAAMQSMDENI